MMKRRENTKQHYLPQCYLRNFSQDRKGIYVYDKSLKKKFISSVDNVAYHDFFYDLPEKYVENLKELPFESRYFEKEFFANNIEDLYCKILEKINLKTKTWIGNNKVEEILEAGEKYLFSQLIAIQYLRMPDIRNKFVDLQKKRVNNVSDLIKSFLKIIRPKYKNQIENTKLVYDEDYNPILHAEIFSDEELYAKIADNIFNKHWVFYASHLNDFYTSDNPIIIKPHIPNQKSLLDGFGMFGAEIIFPIGSSVLLTMWDYDNFSEKKLMRDSFHSISDKEKREYNCYQYIWANKQVYSYINDFSTVDLLIITNGGKEIFMERPKIKVNGK